MCVRFIHGGGVRFVHAVCLLCCGILGAPHHRDNRGRLAQGCTQKTGGMGPPSADLPVLDGFTGKLVPARRDPCHAKQDAPLSHGL